MKTLRILMLALLLPAFVMTGCDRGGDDNGDAQIVLPNDTEKTQTAFADDETSGGFTFTAKQAWTATVTESATRANLSDGSATRADGEKWLHLLLNGEETWSGAAGNFTLVIELDENYSGETRTATITIKSGADTITITVTQDGKTEAGEVPVPKVDVLTKIPDAAFRAYCESEMARWDTDQDGILSVEEAAAVKVIICNPEQDKPASLEGIEYFTGLAFLSCALNRLTSLDVSNNTALTFLNCTDNQISSLDLSKNTALTDLNCFNNQLTSLDLSNNTALTYVECGLNQLTSLDLSKNTALTKLYCANNQLTSLDLSKNTALTDLYCQNNQLTSLDVSSTALTYLNCDNNQLTSLDVSNSTVLTTLFCQNNQLTSLDVSSTALTGLYCSSNQLASLDLSKNTALTDLGCVDNRLTSLDVSKNTALTDLNCGYNPGNGASFPITVWFGEDSPIPSGFQRLSWSFDNVPIEVEYIYL